MTHPTNASHAAAGGGVFDFARDGYSAADRHALKTSDLESATVRGRADETIGTVNSLEVGADGQISGAVIDVGGFLGIGAHPVLVPFGDLTVLRETDGTDVRVHMDATKAKLEAMPRHDA